MAGNVASSSNLVLDGHGTCIDSERKRVKCNHCGHEMSGVLRLKLHLACIKGEVISCASVPATVKALMNNLMKNRNVAKRRSHCPNGSSNGSQKHMRNNELRSNDKRHDEMMLNRTSSNSVDQFFLPPRIGSTSVATSTSAAISYPIRSSGLAATGQPTLTVREVEAAEVQRYVTEVKKSWNETGCSILIDTWINKDGQKLLQLLVESPAGPVYLQSRDISSHEEEAEAILCLVDQLACKIGVENVIQIVGTSNSWDMLVLRDSIELRNDSVFFAMSYSYCIERMIERMEELTLFGGVKKIKRKSKAIVNFFLTSQDAILEQLQDHRDIKDLLMRPIKFRQAKSYTQLQILMKLKERLKFITSSSEWRASTLAQSRRGRRVSRIIWLDHGFWDGASDVLKVIMPMIGVLYSMDSSPRPEMGFIYHTIDEMKSEIENEFLVEDRTMEYDDISELIDEIWNKDLHNDLHSAAYFLNPCLNWIHVDDEVTNGLTNCITRMIRRISVQQSVESEALRCRSEGTFLETFTGSSPVDWWRHRGHQFSRNLQQMAIQILSQTCAGVSRFQLDRSLTENMLAIGRSPWEQKILRDTTFTKYNLDLKNFKMCIDAGMEIKEIVRS